jgi:quercetin dioxygenase-like cupin family protein
MIIVNSNDVETTPSPAGDPIVAKGPVSMKRLIDANTSGGFGVLFVTFSPGAKLNFHTHPAEQILYITDGKGIIATKDKEYTVTPGTVVFIPAGEVHWHGATKNSSFSHLALYKGESKVFEE